MGQLSRFVPTTATLSAPNSANSQPHAWPGRGSRVAYSESVSETTTLGPSLLLPRAKPSDVGVAAQSVEAVLDGFEERGLELHSLMVVRHGHVAAEGWWAPYSADRVHLLYSLSKSFTSTAVGFCVAEGRFSLDDRVVSLLPDHVPDDLDAAVASWTVHHLLSMSTGHSEDTVDRARSGDPDDPVRGFLRIPPDEPVGSRHAYNNTTTYALAAIVEEHTGLPLLDYLRPRLLDPLGIRAARWDTDERGQALGFTGLHLQTESVAAFGQLLLQDGGWRGNRVLPAGWVQLATRSHIENDNDPLRPADWRQGYGYQYWMARHGFRGDGAYGQFCVVVPEQDLVVATTACVDDMQQILDVLWSELLPALDSGAAADSEYAREQALRDRLGTLALPVVVPRGPGPGEAVSFTVQKPRDDAPFATGTRVTVTPESGDVLVEVELSKTRLTFPCGTSRWAEGRLGSGGKPRGPWGGAPVEPTPVVARGGWTSPDTFEADVLLIETPHRIRLRGNSSGLQSSWNAIPLTGPRVESQLREETIDGHAVSGSGRDAGRVDGR